MNLSIKSSNFAGKGTFANQNIKKGQLIKTLSGQEYSEQQIDEMIDKGFLNVDDDFQIGQDKFLLLSQDHYFINYSCDPNAGIRSDNLLVTIKHIAKGEEITFDYSTVSGKPNGFKSKYSNVDWKMVCKCNSANCRREIGYISTLSKQILRKYNDLGVLPNFIKKQLNGELK